MTTFKQIFNPNYYFRNNLNAFRKAASNDFWCPRYSSKSKLKRSDTTGDNTDFFLRMFAYFANWLILFPDRPSAAPICCNSAISSAALTIVSRASCNNRPLTRSVLRTPSVFSSSRIILNSSSVKRVSIFLVLFPSVFRGRPPLFLSFVIRENELRVFDTPWLPAAWMRRQARQGAATNETLPASGARSRLADKNERQRFLSDNRTSCGVKNQKWTGSLWTGYLSFGVLKT